MPPTNTSFLSPYRRFFVTTVLTVSTLLLALTSSAFAVSATVDFEGLAEGQVVSNLSSGAGISGDPIAGVITVFGDSMDPAIVSNAAIVFDATCADGCSGGDPDLQIPSLGNVLIIGEDLVDADGNGLVDDPDDADLAGQIIDFNFVGFGPTGTVVVDSVTVVDVETSEQVGTIEAFAGATLIQSVPILPTGNNGSRTISVDAAGAQRLKITLMGSAAIDNIEIDTASVCGDGVVDPSSGEQCDGSNDTACPGQCQSNCDCPPGPVCGDDSVNQPSEECDGTAVGTACDGYCKSDCSCADCGDGEVNRPGEICDGGDDDACGDGTCLSNCMCSDPVCGDDVVNDPGEDCDGSDNEGCVNMLCQDDCTCVPPIFNDPAKIVFHKVPGIVDRFDAHGRVVPVGGFDPESSTIVIRLTNPEETLYEGMLLPGDCVRKGDTNTWQFRDRNAKYGTGSRDGMYRLMIKDRGGNGIYGFRFRAYGDLDGATVETMTVEIQVGEHRFAWRDRWRGLKRGWKLRFPTPF